MWSFPGRNVQIKIEAKINSFLDKIFGEKDNFLTDYSLDVQEIFGWNRLLRIFQILFSMNVNKLHHASRFLVVSSKVWRTRKKNKRFRSGFENGQLLRNVIYGSLLKNVKRNFRKSFHEKFRLELFFEDILYRILENFFFFFLA